MDYQLELDWPSFLATYWQKRPVVLKKAFKHFIDPISADELAGLAMEPEIDSRLVSKQNGVWQAESGPFSTFDHLGEKNWSLLVQSVNHWHTPSTHLVKPFMKLPYWRFDDLMISFSVPGGSVGPHIDNYDVFIIQGMGKRRWRVGDSSPLKQHCPHPALLHVEPFESMIDELLTPGDILYIPPGFAHEGYTIEKSFNYSIGFRAPNQRELLSSFADHLLDYDLGSTYYQDPDLTLRTNLAQVTPDEVFRLRQLMIAKINDNDSFYPWLGRLLSTSRHELDIAPPEPIYQAEEVSTLLQQGKKLIKLPGIKIINIENAYFINGEIIDHHSPQLLDKLSRYDTFDLTLLTSIDQDLTAMILLTELINGGYWYFAD